MKDRSNNTSPPRPGCRIFVGTGGYAYTEWIEAGFYPPDTPASKMLALYARRFPIVELGTSWYQLPRAESIERQQRRVPPEFLFAAKLTRAFTHEIDDHRWPDLVRAYRDGIAPLVQTRRLAAVLVQLPPTFDRIPRHRRHLAALLDKLHGLPLGVEFCHPSWANPRVAEELRRRQVALVIADSPDSKRLCPAVETVTHPDLTYVRFYGRNTRGWRSRKPAAQFDYSYSDDELRAWIEARFDSLFGRTRRGIIAFNNYVRAQAAWNALRMIDLLREKGLKPVKPMVNRELTADAKGG
jgi:uncharacterized protein YecE (DUF72 family)